MKKGKEIKQKVGQDKKSLSPFVAYLRLGSKEKIIH